MKKPSDTKAIQTGDRVEFLDQSTDNLRSCDFGSLRILYDERVLEPRPWTVTQATMAAESSADAGAGPILELCCGAGQIGLLAAIESQRDIVMIDASPTACWFARANAVHAQWSDRTEVICGDLATAIPTGSRYPIIIADPPWVPSSLVSMYPADPVTSIDGGLNGLGLILECLHVIASHLTRDGIAVLQVGTSEQADAVAAHLAGDPSHHLCVSEIRFCERGVLMRLSRC